MFSPRNNRPRIAERPRRSPVGVFMRTSTPFTMPSMALPLRRCCPGKRTHTGTCGALIMIRRIECLDGGERCGSPATPDKNRAGKAGRYG